jgi:hypothetical protein
MDVDAATRTMIDNIPAKTGRTLAEWFAALDAAGLPQHGKAMAFLKGEHGVSHGFANLIVTLHRQRGTEAGPADLVDAQYAGAKAALRPLYDRLVAAAGALGSDVEIAPKKTGVSLRRAKQFAVIEAPSRTRIALGLNLRDVEATGRLLAAGGMCTHRVDLGALEDIDAEVLGWLREAYDRAG